MIEKLEKIKYYKDQYIYIRIKNVPKDLLYL